MIGSTLFERLMKFTKGEAEKVGRALLLLAAISTMVPIFSEVENGRFLLYFFFYLLFSLSLFLYLFSLSPSQSIRIPLFYSLASCCSKFVAEFIFHVSGFSKVNICPNNVVQV
jgi:hypothetical protein